MEKRTQGHKKDVETFYPKNKEEWRLWLKNNHSSLTSVWVMFYKKSAQLPTISWSEAVDEALCFGWIDSTKKSVDKERFMQYFSRRKPKSTWSKVNKDKIAQLSKQGLMSPAGEKSVQTAKENGSWIVLDAVENLIIPDDLEAAFAKEPNAKECFLNFSKSAKKSILYWIISAKREATRKGRVEQAAKLAGENQKPKQFR